MFRFIKLEVVHWDYWERFSLPLEASVITIVGPNGSGKTTLLDALRTLLCIDCSAGRDYKRYLRRNDKPISWLRAVVDNKRLESGSRPFFPIFSDKVTLACKIHKKGGDWQRQYLVAEGDIEVEKLDEFNAWIGVRDYRQRLEAAGLTRAIRHVLALEQGDTDKLCEYSPRQLLELVFSVFGDQEVLDNYQQAKNEQFEIGRELEKLEEEFASHAVRLREAESNLNSYREWEGLKKELSSLQLEILPRADLADLHTKILSNRTLSHKKRLEVYELRSNYNASQANNITLIEKIGIAQGKQKELEEAEKVASERFMRHRDAARDIEKVIKDKEALESICRQQNEGFDSPTLVAEQRSKQELLAANNHELKDIRHNERELKGRITALKAGEKIEPAHVQEFRSVLKQENIEHRLLVDIIEVVDSGWQKSLEGVIGQYAHIVLLTKPEDRKRAWELGEKIRYRNFIVAERGSRPAIIAGSLLEMVRFKEQAPEWLVELLNRIRIVESVQEGSELSGDLSWVTRDGYYRERRGGRYIGVDAGKFQFGEAARSNMIAGAEAELKVFTSRADEICTENEILVRRIDEIQSLLSGIDAAKQLTARSAEFNNAEKEFPSLTQQVHESTDILTEGSAKLGKARDELQEEKVTQRGLDAEINREENELRKNNDEYKNSKRQLVDQIIDFRLRRKPMPPRWYSHQVVDELREKYESAEAVKRDIKRLSQRLEEGNWFTDEQVVAVKEKLQDDYRHLEETIKVRRIHHNRHVTVTNDARESYINVLRATIRLYSRNVRSLGDLAGIGVEVEPPHLINEDLALMQAGLNVKFNFDKKGMIGLNDGEASGGQQVMKSLILLIALLMNEGLSGGFVFIDEPFAHLDVFNIDKVGAFLECTKAQYVLTTPNTHNVNIFKSSDLTLVTQKRRHPEKWAPPVAFLRRDRQEARK
jgi:chromosome segregation ATPase